MDSMKKLHSTSTQEPSQIPSEEYSADTVSEELAKNLHHLTLTPSTKLHTKRSHQQQNKGKESQGLGLGLSQLLIQRKEKRHGVRTLEAARKEKVIRMMEVVTARTMSLLRKDPQERKREIERRSREFRCSCNYCLYHEDPLDNVSMKNNCDMEPTKP